MPDAEAAAHRRAAVDHLVQTGESALDLCDFKAVCAVNADARGVIAAIFQLCKPVQQNGRGLLLADITNNSAHKKTSVSGWVESFTYGDYIVIIYQNQPKICIFR